MIGLEKVLNKHDQLCSTLGRGASAMLDGGEWSPPSVAEHNQALSEFHDAILEILNQQLADDTAVETATLARLIKEGCPREKAFRSIASVMVWIGSYRGPNSFKAKLERIGGEKSGPATSAWQAEVHARYVTALEALPKLPQGFEGEKSGEGHTRG